ncbi:DUF4105 domain-containing protein [Bdellovibrio sp. HCB117]|uniref:DUF7844 domain-containing protein n=1 Tax=Bdellovibrio sp. HCB117 TaxID=3394359 RepID=UPI0039B6BE37
MRHSKLHFYSIVSALLLFIGGTSASAEVAISEKFRPEQKRQIQESLRQIEELAPAKFSDFLRKQKISLEIQEGLSQDKGIASALGSTIFIHPDAFSSSYFDKNIKTKTNYSDLKTFISATLVHEIAHVIDKKNRTAEEEQYFNANCDRNNDMPRDIQTNQACIMLEQKKGQFSHYPSFVSAAGWQNAMNFERLNFRNQGSPDPYEFTSLRESFAVHMEHFILDETYGCKKPAINTALTKMFGAPLKQKKDCAEYAGFVYTTPGGVTRMVNLSQVQSVSYFFASKGDSAPSKYGHAMIYLTICPPGKDPKKVSCENDINDHLVISPAALVYRGLSLTDGLFGKYDLTLFVVPVPTAIQDYTTKELRDLEVYPLKVNNQEIAATLADFIWNFSGKYYFLSNNCAHSVANVINSVFNMNVITGSSFSPLDLRDTLIKKGLIDVTPKTVFAANRTRKKIKDSVLAAAAVPWDELVAMSNEKRKALFSKIVAAGKTTWAGAAQVQYMIYQAQQDLIGMKLSIFMIEKKKMQDAEIKNLVKKSSDATSNLENRLSYGIPEASQVQTLVNKRDSLEEFRANNADLVAEFKKRHEKILNELQNSNDYYRELLAETIK